ncbi:MAG: undecaprenyl-diphosphatase UppP [Geobacteraceae bacterium]|nr:undecaprenyl-diphosphatase UppP [Geobacteraceae bacterium]
MDLLHAALLGLIQGATEVLPISSSGHLILIPRLLGWPDSGLTFDVALHFGTFLAIFFYFRKDVVTLVQDALTGLYQPGEQKKLRLPWMIVLASVPAAVVGKTLEEPIEALFRSSPLMIALMLILFGLGLGLADRYGKQLHDVASITLGTAMLVGCFQCLALVPGVSRSGITITAGLLLGLARTDAARFSFLLSLPIVFGAALLKGIHLIRHGIEPGMAQPMLVGIVVSAIVGYISVAFLLKFVQNRTLWPFVWYRVAAGIGVMALLGAGLLP